MSLPVSSTRLPSDPPRLALMSAEHALATRIRGGDEAAFEELYLAYYQPLCSFVFMLTARTDLAEELVQDLLCWIWERRAEWSPTDGGMRGYLFRAARNRALNYLKRQHVERRVADTLPAGLAAPGMGRPCSAPDVAAELSDFDDALTHALDELSPRCREACVLHWRHGLTHPEIATAMGVTVKATEALITRGLKSLRITLTAFAGS
jgi:RNA polymerase sigma-70 factor (ECF subfamily)